MREKPSCELVQGCASRRDGATRRHQEMPINVLLSNTGADVPIDDPEHALSSGCNDSKAADSRVWSHPWPNRSRKNELHAGVLVPGQAGERLVRSISETGPGWWMGGSIWRIRSRPNCIRKMIRGQAVLVFRARLVGTGCEQCCPDHVT
jgi:hypothetical protein